MVQRRLELAIQLQQMRQCDSHYHLKKGATRCSDLCVGNTRGDCVWRSDATIFKPYSITSHTLLRIASARSAFLKWTVGYAEIHMVYSIYCTRFLPCSLMMTLLNQMLARLFPELMQNHVLFAFCHLFTLCTVQLTALWNFMVRVHPQQALPTLAPQSTARTTNLPSKPRSRCCVIRFYNLQEKKDQNVVSVVVERRVCDVVMVCMPLAHWSYVGENLVWVGKKVLDV